MECIAIRKYSRSYYSNWLLEEATIIILHVIAYLDSLKAEMLLYQGWNKAFHFSFHSYLFKSMTGKPWENYTNSHNYLKSVLSLHASTPVKALDIFLSILFFY